MLVGCIETGEVKQAWFFNRLTSQKQALQVGELLKVSDMNLRLTAMEQESVRFISAELGKTPPELVDGKIPEDVPESRRFQLRLGESLRSLQKPPPMFRRPPPQ